MRHKEPKGTADVTTSQVVPSFPESPGSEVCLASRGILKGKRSLGNGASVSKACWGSCPAALSSFTPHGQQEPP